MNLSGRNDVLVEIDELMGRLARRRPVFHSEADFQHEFASEAKGGHPELQVRLERPFPGRATGAIDIILRSNGSEHAIELKYLTRTYEGKCEEEHFRLKNQGAQDVRSYDVCKDIARMESFCLEPGRIGSVVVLTNEPYYWKSRTAVGTCAEAFEISGMRELSGTLAWAAHTGAGTMKNREAPIVLASKHVPEWKDYSDVGERSGRFRYFCLSVQSAKV
jgi:hypothetical protein